MCTDQSQTICTVCCVASCQYGCQVKKDGGFGMIIRINIYSSRWRSVLLRASITQMDKCTWIVLWYTNTGRNAPSPPFLSVLSVLAVHPCTNLSICLTSGQRPALPFLESISHRRSNSDWYNCDAGCDSLLQTRLQSRLSCRPILGCGGCALTGLGTTSAEASSGHEGCRAGTQTVQT